MEKLVQVPDNFFLFVYNSGKEVKRGMVMEAVLYSTFRNHLKDYMKKVNNEFEPLTVVNKNPDEDIVVLSKSEWDSIQETLKIAQNKELSDKVLRGMSQVRAGHTQVHVIEE